MESRKTLGEWLDYIEAMHGGAEVIDLGPDDGNDLPDGHSL